MKYIVKYSNKKAIFSLTERDENFGDVRDKVAEYFGLPRDKVFLQNKKNEILLNKQPVLEEFWPMMTSQICGESP